MRHLLLYRALELTHKAVGYCVMSIMNSSQTLMVDLMPGKSSAVTACVGPTFNGFLDLAEEYIRTISADVVSVQLSSQ